MVNLSDKQARLPGNAERGRRVHKLATPLFLALALLVARPGVSGVEDVEIGLHYDAAFPQLDLKPMEIGQSYGLLGHYWLTDVTSIDVGFDWFTSTWGVEVDQSREHLDFQMWLASAGIRYEPEVDFVLAPYAGAGLGYQQWNTRSSIDGVDNRQGGGLAYYVLLGADGLDPAPDQDGTRGGGGKDHREGPPESGSFGAGRRGVHLPVALIGKKKEEEECG